MTPLRLVGNVSEPSPANQLREARAALVKARLGLEQLIRFYAARDGVVSFELDLLVLDLHEQAGTLTRLIERMERGR